MKKILFVISVFALNCKQDHKFLFADESFIDTTISNFYNVGVTENVTIAYILKDKGALIIEDSNSYLFIMDKKESYHICLDPTHEICDGSCECDGIECINNDKK